MARLSAFQAVEGPVDLEDAAQKLRHLWKSMQLRRCTVDLEDAAQNLRHLSNYAAAHCPALAFCRHAGVVLPWKVSADSSPVSYVPKGRGRSFCS